MSHCRGMTGDVELLSAPGLWVEANSTHSTETHAAAQKTIHRQELIISQLLRKFATQSRPPSLGSSRCFRKIDYRKNSIQFIGNKRVATNCDVAHSRSAYISRYNSSSSLHNSPSRRIEQWQSADGFVISAQWCAFS